MARPSSPALPEQIRAAALAITLSVFFLGESLLPGRVLLPFAPVCFSPWFEAAAPAERKAAVARAVPHLADKWLQCLPFGEVTGERWRELDPPVWTSRLFGGQMLAGDVVPQPFHPLQVLASAAGTAGTLALVFLCMQAATGWFCFRFLRVLGLPELACHLGLVSWTAGLWVQARVHHPMVLTAAFTLPLVLEAVERLARGEARARSTGILALGVGSCWLGGFTQAAVQCTVLAGAYALYRVFALQRDSLPQETPAPQGLSGGPPALPPPPARAAWSPSVQRLVLAASGIAAGCLMGAVQTLPALEAARLSVRGRESVAEQRRVALQPAHLIQALVPTAVTPVREFVRDRVENTRTSFTDLLLVNTSQAQRFNHTETAFYAGLAPLLLALGALFRRRPHGAMFFSAALALALLLAFGVWPVLELAHAVPGLGVGDPKRFLLTASFSLSVLGALGLGRLLRGNLGRLVPGAAAALALLGVAGAAALALTSDDGIAHWFGHRLAARYARETGFHETFLYAQFLASIDPLEPAWNAANLRRSFFVLAATAVLVLPCLRRGRVRPAWLGILLLAVTSAELLVLGHGRCLAIPRDQVLSTPPILRPVVEDRGLWRFQRFAPPPPETGPGESRPDAMHSPRLIPPNLPLLLGIADAAGYSVFTTRRLDEFWNAVEPGLAQGGAIGAFTLTESLRSPVLDAFGVRWILADRELSVPGLSDATPAAATATGLRLYRREGALPRAHLVHATRVLADTGARLRFLGSPLFQPEREVVLEDVTSPGLRGRDAADDRVEVVRAGDEEVLVRAASGSDAYLVLADPWYPGWKAFVDGTEVPLFVADHVLRAVHLAPGSHEVRFAFESRTLALGAALSAVAAAFALMCLVLAAWRRPAS